MSLRRFYTGSPVAEGEFVIEGDLFHHIRDVCRFTVGARFELLPGDGRAVLVEIISIAKRTLNAQQMSARDLPALSKPFITLALSLPKLPKFDWITEKCVELGVDEIRPFTSDYSFLREPGEISGARTSRWQKLVVAATQQSGRGELMRIQPTMRLPELLKIYKQTPHSAGLFAYEAAVNLGLHRAIADLKAQVPERIWLFVGSEGGFSEREVEFFGAAGLEPVTMGEQILRVETACLALVSVIKYETRGLA